MTPKKTRRRGFAATSEGAELLSRLIHGKGHTQDTFAEAAGTNPDQVKRLCNPGWGYRVEKGAILKIAEALELKPTDFIDPAEWMPESKTSAQRQTDPAIEIDWRRVCLEMLQAQQKES